MSNFETYTTGIQGIPGTAAKIWSASTADSLATITAPGYLNDLGNKTKLNDFWFINYSDTSTQPLGEASIFGTFRTTVDSLGNMNLTATTQANGVATLAANGVHTAKFTNPGGSATTTITDARIVVGMAVTGKWQSSANAVIVQKITVAAGTLTVLSSGDPGASVFAYEAVLPGGALNGSGIHAAIFTNAGGSATTTITDANITANSIVFANWATSATAVSINKVTATAGTLTILSSADPVASTLAYIAITPSLELQSTGFYANQNTYAGGATTLTITDANITASSVIDADFSSSANAAVIEKVTPAAGSLALLFSTNPGASVINYGGTPVSV